MRQPKLDVIARKPLSQADQSGIWDRERLPVQRACREVGIGRVTYYRRRVGYGAPGCADERRRHAPKR
jgi:hypothetical protein